MVSTLSASNTVLVSDILGTSEVSKQGIALLIDKDVLWLDVSMDNIMFVHFVSVRPYSSRLLSRYLA